MKWLLYYLFGKEIKSNMVEIQCRGCGIIYRVEPEYKYCANYCNAQCAIGHLALKGDL